jgi:sugar/nucleoside kinase (ribokinase family)
VTSDAFAGALLAGIAKEQPLETCIDMGHWLAYLGIQQMGPKYVLPFLRLYQVLLTRFQLPAPKTILHPCLSDLLQGP